VEADKACFSLVTALIRLVTVLPFLDLANKSSVGFNWLELRVI